MSTSGTERQLFPFLGDGIAQELGQIPLVAATLVDLVPGTGWNPRVPRRAHPARTAPAFFAPPLSVAVVGPTDVAMLAVYPARVNARPRTAHLRPSYFAPIFRLVVAGAGFPPSVYPARVNARPRTAHLRPSYFAPQVTPTVAVGILPEVTFAADMESGGRVTYAYSTDVVRTRRGLEHRHALVDYPRRTYEFSSVLDDGPARDVRAAMFARLAKALPFGLALPHEGLTIQGVDGAGTTLTVNTTVNSDWLVAGRRVVLRSPDPNVPAAYVVVQGVAASTILYQLPAIGGLAAGWTIMPLEVVYLDPAQGLASYAVNAEVWQLKATAAYANTTLGVLGAGSVPLTTFHLDSPPAPGLESDIPVWDFPLSASSLVQGGLSGKTETEDGGSLVQSAQVEHVSDIVRQISVTINSDARRQWVKQFFATCRGRQKAFFLPTWKEDVLVYAQPVAGALDIFGGPNTLGGGDYAGQFFNQPGSVSHCFLQFLHPDGSVSYHQVDDAIDNGDGTQSLLLHDAYTGTVDRISFLELVRFDSDELTLEWTGSIARATIMARTVEQ